MGIDEVKRAAVFLDRDGVLVEEIYYRETGEIEAPMRPEDVRLIPEAAAAALRLRAMGFLLILISNQGAAAKGKIGLDSLWRTHLRFTELLLASGVTLDAEYYSFSHPDGVVPGLSGASLDRKPSPYHLMVAAARFDLDLGRSWMVGDRSTDVDCGRAAGAMTIRIDTNALSGTDRHAGSLAEAAEIIAAHSATMDRNQSLAARHG